VLALGLIATGSRLPVADVILENAGRAETMPTVIELVRKWAFGPQAPGEVVEAVTARMAETRPAVFHGDFLACSTYNLSERLEAIDTPALVLCGEEDRMTPPRLSHFLADHLPAARLQLFPHGGHMLMLEQPEVVAAALVDFIHGLPYRPGI